MVDWLVGRCAFADLHPLRGGAITGYIFESIGNKARPGRDQLTDDDVFLQTEERIGGRADGRTRQHFDRVLEG